MFRLGWVHRHWDRARPILLNVYMSQNVQSCPEVSVTLDLTFTFLIWCERKLNGTQSPYPPWPNSLAPPIPNCSDLPDAYILLL
jgi:alpha-amylase/alpha-mannosidase (GH57 family)